MCVKYKDSDYICSASDYDDFYIAVKEDCKKQIEDAEYILEKVEKYLQGAGVENDKE